MSILADSGERTNFETGAMREIVPEKGRCDLLPLSVVAELVRGGNATEHSVLYAIDQYIRGGETFYLLRAICLFCQERAWELPTAMLEVAIHYQDGANKYADRNWEKGLPVNSFIDSGVRHYLKFQRGDTDEPHDRAFIWNMLGAIWTHKNMPELINLPFKDKEEKVCN